MKTKASLIIFAFAASCFSAHAEITAIKSTKKNDLAKLIKAAVFEGDATAPEIVPIQGDPDGGDGVSDGCVKVNSTSTGGLNGATAALGTVDAADQLISLSTHVFNKNSSYVKYSVQFYNTTDKRVLASSPQASLNPKDNSTEKTVTLEYRTTAEDQGDTIEIRWIQHSTDSTARDLYIDNFQVKTS